MSLGCPTDYQSLIIISADHQNTASEAALIRRNVFITVMLIGCSSSADGNRSTWAESRRVGETSIEGDWGQGRGKTTSSTGMRRQLRKSSGGNGDR